MQQTRVTRKEVSVGRMVPKFKYSETFDPVYEPNRTRVSYQTENPIGKRTNDDIDWLQKLVHGFQCFRGLKKNQVTHNIERLTGVEANKQKIGMGQKNHSYSQRKILSDFANKNQNYNSRESNMIKQFTQNATRTGIQNSTKNKSMHIELIKTKPKQKVSSNHFNKQRVNENTKVNQFIDTSDAKDVKAIHKYSLNDNKTKSSYNKKVANVRIARRDFIDAVTTKKSCGKIIKNKSLQVEEKYNRKQKQNCESNTKLKSESTLHQKDQNKQIQLKETKNNEANSKLFIKSPKYSNFVNISKEQVEKTELNELVQQLKNKKIKQSLTSDQRYVGIQKQRKLNRSFGQRKNNQTALPAYFLDSKSNKEENACKLGGDKLCCSVILTKNDQIPQICQQIQQNCIPQICQPPKTTVFANRIVKCVQSTKNSQVLTEHSIVQQKAQCDKYEKSKINNQQANILSIFNKLDCKKLGYLTAQNCSVENVSREIRYILGAVLERILSQKEHFDFNMFIKQVEGTLQKVDYQIQQPSCKNNIFQVKTTDKTIVPDPLQKSHSKSNRKQIQSEELCSREQVKKIRYTTFQDQQRQSKENLFQKSKQTEYQTNYQQRFENKINILSDFRSQIPMRKLTPSYDRQVYNSVSKLRLQNSRQNYKNQIVQLDQLNKRLESYLSRQNLNEFSDSKLNIRDV